LPELPAAVVEELVQDTLEIVWLKWPAFRMAGPPFEAWVRGIAKNVCRNARRKRRDLLTPDGLLDLADPSPGALDALERAEQHAVVQHALAAVVAFDRALLLARYELELSREETARRLGMQEPAKVRGALVAARSRLRRRLLASAPPTSTRDR
jgi:RNA polymerase sigma factor (sigma-70 family)